MPMYNVCDVYRAHTCVCELFVRSIAEPDCRDMIVWSIRGLTPLDIAANMKAFSFDDAQCFKQEDKDQTMDIVSNVKTGTKACTQHSHYPLPQLSPAQSRLIQLAHCQHQSLRKALLLVPEETDLRASGNLKQSGPSFEQD